MTNKGLTRRQTLVATGAGVLAAGFGLRPALAETTVKQGYQTNMWGMPTYYLLHSGHLAKHGIKHLQRGAARADPLWLATVRDG